VRVERFFDDVCNRVEANLATKKRFDCNGVGSRQNGWIGTTLTCGATRKTEQRENSVVGRLEVQP
jgi:hypothetical protein